MHRSGTSCIMRIFNLLGVSIGNNLISPQEDNPEGFWEDWYLVQINRQILKNSKGSWDKPPEKIKLSLKNKLDILSFINNQDRSKIFGFKDPRMLLTWNAWKPFLKNYTIVSVFRHPSSVSQSLYVRNKIDNEYANYLWEIYNKKLIKINENENMTFINFDNNSSFERKIKKVSLSLGLNYDDKALNFYNPSNRNSDKIEEISNEINKKIYNQLLEFE